MGTRKGLIVGSTNAAPVAIGLAVTMLLGTLALRATTLLAAYRAVETLLFVLLPILARNVRDKAVLAKAPVAALVLACKHA